MARKRRKGLKIPKRIRTHAKNIGRIVVEGTREGIVKGIKNWAYNANRRKNLF